MRLVVLLCVWISGVVSYAHAQQSPISLPSFDGSIEIDGELDDAAWESAAQVELNIVTWPSENTVSPVNTTAKVIENGETLYVAFVAQDPQPELIRAYFRDRDRVRSDDLVGVKLDTFNNGRLAYQFFSNPYGVQIDEIENEMTGSVNASWDGIWQSKGKITDTGYQVEIALPLRLFNFKQSTQKTIWGIEFVRWYPRDERQRISNVPDDRNNACSLCQMARIEGFEQVQQSKNLAIVPALVTGKGRTRDVASDSAWEYQGKAEVGLDVQWAMSPEVLLQATVNPDFSQVEADVAQLSINKPFALFFDEKRPFFMENADYFSTNLDLVYTRNIASPDFGLKTTGRIDNHTFGVFAAKDESTFVIVPGNITSSLASIEDSSSNVALRYRSDVSADWSVGASGTLREADSYHNHVYAVDSKYRITPQDVLKVQLLQSDTRYPDSLAGDFCYGLCQSPDDFVEAYSRVNHSDNLSGSGYLIYYSHRQRDWFVRTKRTKFSEGFRADLGFMPAIDRVSDSAGAGYFWYNENSWWNEIEINADVSLEHNNNGELIEREVKLHANMVATMQTYLEVNVEQRDRVGLRYDPRSLTIDGNTSRFTEKLYSANYVARPVSAVYIDSYLRFGERIDFTNDRLGDELLFQQRLIFSIGKHALLDLRHTYQELDAEGQEVFTANLSDVRLTYQFDERQFLRLVASYTDIERNLSNYNDPQFFSALSRDLGTQLLYSYKLDPFTKLVVGYSDYGFEDDTTSSLRTSEQSLFMKISYAWLQ